MLLVFDRAVQQPAGNPRIAEQPRDEQRRAQARAADRTFDNVQGSAEQAPTGTSAQAGLRRLLKEVEAGNATANRD
jgi:hypothetical protein